MKYDNGVHAITSEQYHTCDAISRSDLMRFKRSPMHYLHKEILVETPALIIGELVHTLVLEPDMFNVRYAVNPGIDRRTTVGRQMYMDFCNKSEGKKIIDSNHFSEARKMADAVSRHEFAQYLNQGFTIENSIFFEHSTGIQCKVRPDAWLGDIVIDLKTSADASPKSFQSSAFNYGYYLQAGMIKRALASLNMPLKNFIFVVIEKSAPYPIGIYRLDDESIEYGAMEFDKLMYDLNQSIQKNEFPDYGVHTLSLPFWAKSE